MPDVPLPTPSAFGDSAKPTVILPHPRAFGASAKDLNKAVLTAVRAALPEFDGNGRRHRPAAVAELMDTYPTNYGTTEEYMQDVRKRLEAHGVSVLDGPAPTGPHVSGVILYAEVDGVQYKAKRSAPDGKYKGAIRVEANASAFVSAKWMDATDPAAIATLTRMLEGAELGLEGAGALPGKG